ncbi:MAG: hypothetical protein E4G99_10470 [Anaerolineales bacterium]|nr:MAG: hypothetical protein E4G99_10470 [Anaerolineales bacterium]
MKEDVELVGYGIQGWVRGTGEPFTEPIWDFQRYFAPAELIASKHVHHEEYIKLTANPADGKGGECFGDSGGPDLLGGSDTILAVNSYVTNSNCTGVTYSNRIDLNWAPSFIEGFMGPWVK